jgi:DNA-binding transcriptional LysR family regulator
MLDLNDIRFFVEVVERGGFSAASRALQRPTSTVSYRIQQLERELGLTLLARTSRTVAMTEAGELFYRHAAAVIDRANEAEGIMRGRSVEPIGTVRYSVAIDVAHFAMPEMLGRFMRHYPGITLVQHVGNAPVDIVADRYDLAIRAHRDPLPDSQLVQRPLAAGVPSHLFASPDLVARAGPLSSPADLEAVDTLFMKRDPVEPAWRLVAGADRSVVVDVALRPRILGTCMQTLKQAAEQGIGIVALPAYICRDEVASGRLVRVLPDWLAGESRITALMPHRRGMTAATRAFIDHIAAEFPHAIGLSRPSHGEKMASEA